MIEAATRSQGSQRRTLLLNVTTHGDFDDFDELTKVPGIDVDKLEERRASPRLF
jgi:hypothetical protein